MTGPWFITPAAVLDYLAILGWPDTEANYLRARDDLLAMARLTLASSRQPVLLDSGALRYRGPGPERLTLVVVPAPRQEGDLPQLVSVTTGPRGRR